MKGECIHTLARCSSSLNLISPFCILRLSWAGREWRGVNGTGGSCWSLCWKFAVFFVKMRLSVLAISERYLTKNKVRPEEKKRKKTVISSEKQHYSTGNKWSATGADLWRICFVFWPLLVGTGDAFPLTWAPFWNRTANQKERNKIKLTFERISLKIQLITYVLSFLLSLEVGCPPLEVQVPPQHTLTWSSRGKQ